MKYVHPWKINSWVKKEITYGQIIKGKPVADYISEKLAKRVGILKLKGVDCFSPVNIATVMENDATGFLPARPDADILIVGIGKA